MRRIVLAGAAMLAVSALAVMPAYGTQPGKNGSIVFQHSGGRLWLVNSDGSGLTKLTTTKGRLDDNNPDWSPDGSKIVFERCQQICQIWRINANGTGLGLLGPPGLDRGQPSYSPNGALIAYSRGWGGVQNDQIKFAEIYVMNARGAGARQLTHVTTGKPFSADVEYPAWSPNGKQLAFTLHNSKTGDPAGGRALFVINPDGSGLHQVTPWELNGGGKPDWSPDGKLILFRLGSPTHPDHGNLATIHPDGTGLKRLTNYPEKALISGSFSPDGKWITFCRFTTYDYPSVFVMRSNGTGIHQVTPSDVHGIAYAADWGPTR